VRTGIASSRRVEWAHRPWKTLLVPLQKFKVLW
jgi:hypothetical protein